VELILETHLCSISEFLSHLEIFSNEILSAESQISIGLDIAQHYLLILSTFFTLGSLCTIGFTAVFGAFSMNLDVEEWKGSSEVRFVALLSTSVLVIIGIISYFLYFSVREGFVFI
jgi:hypothetical protein